VGVGVFALLYGKIKEKLFSHIEEKTAGLLLSTFLK